MFFIVGYKNVLSVLSSDGGGTYYDAVRIVAFIRRLKLWLEFSSGSP